MTGDEIAETDVAIIGIAGRFPGAADVDELWARVAAGDDCLTDLDAADLVAAGVPASTVRSPAYVTRSGVLDDVEGFDHDFFGIGSRDAAVMDPQHRHFLECSWEVLESAAIVPERFDGAIGVFGGCGMNTYLLNNLLTNGKVLPQLGWFLLRHTGNDKDFFTNNVAYRLDLRGPAVNVQTACSTSLVAVHLAVQSLLAFETDLALAGGATIEVPHRVGYEFHEGEILAADGVCRAFDARSGGTVLTSGVAVVALRRLADALDGGDPVLAVIKGSAINNDGSRKVSFLAPSVDGHADVVREALTVAGLSARDLQLFEAHGTGTAVGDPIEIAAVTEAFRTFTPDRGFCRVTSTKPNIGHLDTAAGGASLIKVVQALRHRTLPPLANHTAPSPLLDLEHSPFHLAATADPWPGDVTRRAGISSLGVGGTNAHVVVEEAPEVQPAPPSPPEQVIALSAMTSAALDAAGARLARHLAADPTVDLGDVSHTLLTGRRAMPHRRVVTATDLETAVRVLGSDDRHRSGRAVVPDGAVRLGFMFPGGGSQYVGMGSGLDDRFRAFHEARAEGVELVHQFGGPDLRPLMAPGGDRAGLLPASASLPAVFVTSIALARQWMAFGATPDLFVGHSLGEYTAAHLAGVMSFEDAVKLVVLRSALMQRDSGTDAAMLAVSLPEDELRAIMPPTLDLAAVNADGECVVAGRAGSINELAAVLEARGSPGTVLALSAAAHSALLDPMLDELADAVGSVTLKAPTIPYPSNLTGDWITPEQATSPQYWASHTRSTVRFADCVRTAVGDTPLVLAELGPGQALSSFARRATPRPLAVIPTLRHPDHDIDDTAFTLEAFAKLWASGVGVDLDQFNGGGRRRLRLPTYAFQHERCWIEPGTASLAVAATTEPLQAAVTERIEDLDQACWTVQWDAAASPTERVLGSGGWWLVVGDDGDELANAIAVELRTRQVRATLTTPGALDFTDPDIAGAVLVAPAGADAFGDAVQRWFVDATATIAELGTSTVPVRLVTVLREALAVDGPAARPADAMALGLVLVGGREYPGVATHAVDVDGATTVASIVDDVLGSTDAVIARRADGRLVPSTTAVLAPRPADDAVTFREGGTYLVTGGLGGVGHVLAAHLATSHRANLVLVASAEVPEGDQRARWLATHAYDDATSRRIRQLAALEQLGTKVAHVVADVGDPDALRAALDEAERKVGRITGAVHAAGQLRDSLLEFASLADHEVVLGAKAGGALVLADELRRREAELLVLVSSTSSLLAPAGQASYVGANAVLDALAGHHGDLRIATINFGLWSEVGVASAIARRARLGIEDGEPVEHPVFSERRTARDGTTVLVGRVDAAHHWVADEHRTAEGVAVYPGTGHLHLMRTAAELAGRGDVQLLDAALLAPLVVPEGAVITVRVDVSPDGVIEIYSDGGRGQRWTLHSQAATAPTSDDPIRGDPIAEFDALHLHDVELLSAQRVHMAFGPRWDAVVEARRGEGTVIAKLALPAAVADEAAQWSPHPALVDVATAAGVALAPPRMVAALYVPTRYRRVRTLRPLPPEVIVRAVAMPSTAPDRLVVDLTVVDLAGEPVLDITGLELLGSPDHVMLNQVDDDDDPTPTSAPNLVALADELGLRPHEGAELVERLVASDLDRMIGSTIALDDLLAWMATPEGGGGEPASASTGDRASSLELALTTLWADLLGLDTVGPDDDFFDLGGHSLIAIRLMSRIQQDIGVRLQLTTIFDAPTVATLSARIRADHPGIDAAFAAGGEDAATAVEAIAASRTEMTKHLVPISTQGAGRPLYVVHGAGGNILFLARFGRAMSAMRPVYGFQAHGVDGHDVPDATVEAMVERYVDELVAHAPGPYLLGGYSGGGTVALEMSRRLQEMGERVDVVVLFDSPVGRISLGRWVHLRHLVTNTLRFGPKPVMPIVTTRLHENRLGRALFWGGKLADTTESHELNYQDMVAHGFHDLYDHFGEIVEEYTVGTYDVDAILVKAQLRWPLMPFDYGWPAQLRGRFQMIVAPGDHESMFHGVNVQTMVAELAGPLSEYD